eukprot:gene8522-8704_t
MAQRAALASSLWGAAEVVTSRSYHVARLVSRGVISMSGTDCVQFLQGMTTNDMQPLEQPAKGKYLHDLFAISVPGDTPQLLLDVDAAGVGSALAWLNKYKLRRKLSLADVSHQYSVWAAFEGDLRAGEAGEAALC